MRDRIIVVGGGIYCDPFEELGRVSTNTQHLIASPEETALVLFTGGEDVHPSFYEGTDTNNMCGTNYRRDLKEKGIFDYCRKYNIKMTGICRGFQFLNVMDGGAMYQHVDNHEMHGMHPVYMMGMDTEIDVTSTHHQLVKLGHRATPIAWASPPRVTTCIGPHGGLVDPSGTEIESAIFQDINAMGVQYHPEYMKKDLPGRIHYISMMRDFIGMSMDDFTERHARREKHAHVRQQSGN